MRMLEADFAGPKASDQTPWQVLRIVAAAQSQSSAAVAVFAVPVG